MKHVAHLINAYHDGELSLERKNQVEFHLESCESCRREYEALQSLSVLLQEDIIEEQFTPANRFVAQVVMQMPRRTMLTPQQKLWRFAWKAIPVGLAGAWVFVQAVFMVAFVLYTVMQTGALSSVLSFLPEQRTSILSELLGFASVPGLKEIGGLILQLVTFNDPALQSMLIYLFLQFLIGILFCAWLVSWWISREKRSAEGLIKEN